MTKPKVIKKGSKEYNANLAKLKELQAAGYKVKLDGSWGPYLLKLYSKLLNESFLDKAGRAWDNFWNSPMAVPMMSSDGSGRAPIMYTGTKDKKPMHYTSTPKKEAQLAMTMASGLVLPATAGAYGVVPTLVGMGTGTATGYVGGKAGKKGVELLGGNELAQLMGEDLGEFFGAGFGFDKGVKFTLNPHIGNWSYRVPTNENNAYRFIDRFEKEDILTGNPLRTRASNTSKEIEAYDTERRNVRFSLFKASQEHGGRKLFSKGQPWSGTTTTHGEKHILEIPGKDLPWVSGRHYNGPQGHGFGVGDLTFEEAPFGSHIDLLTEDGVSEVVPSLLKGSAIYSPYKLPFMESPFGFIKTNLKSQGGPLSSLTNSNTLYGESPTEIYENLGSRLSRKSDADSPISKWEDLSMKERHLLIRVGVLNGDRDIRSIRDKYNLFALGGLKSSFSHQEIPNVRYDTGGIKQNYVTKPEPYNLNPAIMKAAETAVDNLPYLKRLNRNAVLGRISIADPILPLDIYHQFGDSKYLNKFDETVSVMRPIVQQALIANNYQETNLDNMVRLIALESNYGLENQGSNKYNMTGIKWTKGSKDYKHSKGTKDNELYIDFDNLYDFANYHVLLLNNRFDAVNAKDTLEFIDRLHPKGKPNYSGDYNSYNTNLKNTKSLNRYLSTPYKTAGIKK